MARGRCVDERVEVSVEVDRAIAGAGIDLSVEFIDLDRTVARVYLKLPAAIRDIDWAIARTKRDLACDPFQIQRAITG